MKRNFHQARPWRDFAVPCVMAVLAIYFDVFHVYYDAELISSGGTNPQLLTDMQKQEIFWIPLSRFCYCFTVVGVHYYQMREMGYQKALVALAE